MFVWILSVAILSINFEVQNCNKFETMLRNYSICILINVLILQICMQMYLLHFTRNILSHFSLDCNTGIFDGD